jgi:hypothetical protein
MTRKAMPTRKPNSAYRSREHLLEREVEALIKAAKGNRHGLRDSTIILMMSPSASCCDRVVAAQRLLAARW